VTVPTNSLCERCVSDGAVVREIGKRHVAKVAFADHCAMCDCAMPCDAVRAAAALEARIAACGCSKPQYPAVHLYRVGSRVRVALKIRQKWVRVIDVALDSYFSHIVEPSGIHAAIAAKEGR
jgi:hypothetical protein